MIRLWKLTNKLNEQAYYQELLKEQQQQKPESEL